MEASCGPWRLIGCPLRARWWYFYHLVWNLVFSHCDRIWKTAPSVSSTSRSASHGLIKKWLLMEPSDLKTSASAQTLCFLCHSCGLVLWLLRTSWFQLAVNANRSTRREGDRGGCKWSIEMFAYCLVFEGCVFFTHRDVRTVAQSLISWSGQEAPSRLFQQISFHFKKIFCKKKGQWVFL